MKFIDLAKTHYFHEVQRRNDLNSSLNLITGLLIALFAGLGTMASTVTMPISKAEWVLLALCLCAAAAGLWAIWNVAKSYLPRPNKHPKYLGDIKAEMDGWVAAGDSSLVTSRKLAALTTDAYWTSADTNARNNDAKNRYINSASKSLVIMVALTVAAALPYLFNKIAESPALAKSPSASRVSVYIETRGRCEQEISAPAAAAPASPTTIDENRPRERLSAKAKVNCMGSGTDRAAAGRNGRSANHE
jgi:hypothetical protein